MGKSKKRRDHEHVHVVYSQNLCVSVCIFGDGLFDNVGAYLYTCMPVCMYTLYTRIFICIYTMTYVMHEGKLSVPVLVSWQHRKFHLAFFLLAFTVCS